MQNQVEDYKDVINKALAHFFADLPQELDLDLSPQGQDALQKIEEYSLRPGKRIRGALACFAYDYATGQKQGKTGVQAAVALELVQNYLLIVDDVMDRSALRRGKPTVHELYLTEQEQGPKDQHLANMLAINVGLITQHLVNLVLAEVDERPAYVREALLLLHKNILATGFGQIDDASQHIGVSVTEADIIRKYTLKSGYYTFVCPLQLGLVLGGKNDQVLLKEVTEFGLAAGIAFQLKDDMLGIFAATEATGKPNTDDIEEGKYTLLIQYAFEHAKQEDVQYLKEVLGKSNVTTESVANVRSILESCGSKQYIQESIGRYAEQAHKIIEKSTFWDDAAKATLMGIVDYSIQRQR
jgi:geranylgeranyl diphosphate synthase, type I